MTDRLGHRLVLGVLIPSVNTTVQPEFDILRPPGVSNQTGRFHLPNVSDHESIDANGHALPAHILSAVDMILACGPDAIALAFSTEMRPGGREGAAAVKEQVEARAKGVPVTTATFAVPRALDMFGAKRISIITPFDASGDANVKAFFEESGYDVKAIKGLRRGTGTGIATTSEADIRAAFAEVDGADVEALVHVGSNMPVMDICADLERTLGKPVIGVNQATYWAALRENGIDDRLPDRGRLLAEF